MDRLSVLTNDQVWYECVTNSLTELLKEQRGRYEKLKAAYLKEQDDLYKERRPYDAIKESELRLRRDILFQALYGVDDLEEYLKATKKAAAEQKPALEFLASSKDSLILQQMTQEFEHLLKNGKYTRVPSSGNDSGSSSPKHAAAP